LITSTCYKKLWEELKKGLFFWRQQQQQPVLVILTQKSESIHFKKQLGLFLMIV